jgi:hypothetical protein
MSSKTRVDRPDTCACVCMSVGVYLNFDSMQCHDETRVWADNARNKRDFFRKSFCAPEQPAKATPLLQYNQKRETYLLVLLPYMCVSLNGHVFTFFGSSEHTSAPYRVVFNEKVPGIHRIVITWPCDTKTCGYAVYVLRSMGKIA